MSEGKEGLMASQTSPVGDGALPVPSPAFGDIVENGWASESNPTRVGYFVRKGHRTGRMNAGTYWEVTDGKGRFWELCPRGEHKITVHRKAAGEKRPFGWCSPAEAVLLDLTESLREGLFCDAGLSDDDRTVMRRQLIALFQALDGVRAAERPFALWMAPLIAGEGSWDEQIPTPKGHRDGGEG